MKMRVHVHKKPGIGAMIRKRNLGRAVSKALHDPLYAARVFRKRFSSFLSYQYGGGASAFPETISLFLTYRCNLRCKMCGQWGEDGWARNLPRDEVLRELPVDRLETLIENVSSFKPAITLFGGEPLMYSHWEELVLSIKSAGLRVNMITNGTLLGRYIEKTVDLGVDELIFSLDGPEDIHDEIRSGQGIFAKATEAFRELDRYKRERGRSTPRVNVNTTIFETNYRRLDEVVDVVEDIGADAVTFHHLIFTSQDMCTKNSAVFREEFGLDCRDWTGFSRDDVPDIDVEHLIASLHSLKKRTADASVSVYPNFTDEEIRRYYTSFDFAPSSYKPRCMSPWMTVYIFPDGSVKPCLDACYVAGNILDDSFTDIWNNERFKHYRSVLKKRGHFPACTRCTEFYRS